MEAVTIEARNLEIGDRLTEWSGGDWAGPVAGPVFYGPALGPGERVTEIHGPDDWDGWGMVEAWTDTGAIAGHPAVYAYPWDLVTVWREVGR